MAARAASAFEMLPVLLGDPIIVVGDVDHRAAVGDDDRLERALLEAVHPLGRGELAERALDRLLRLGGERVEAGDRLGPAGVEAFQRTDRLDLAKEAGGLLGDKVRHATSLCFGRSFGGRLGRFAVSRDSPAKDEGRQDCCHRGMALLRRANARLCLIRDRIGGVVAVATGGFAIADRAQGRGAIA